VLPHTTGGIMTYKFPFDLLSKRAIGAKSIILMQVMDHVGIEAHVCSSVAYRHWNIYIHVLELVWSGDASPKVRKSCNKFILKVRIIIGVIIIYKRQHIFSF
jgi:hypothetical protein